MRTPVVDAHLHVWEMPSERFPWSPLRNMQPAEPAPVEVLLETMEQNGVDKAIIVQPSNYGYDHRYVSDCLARYPGRFGAVALFDFRAPDAVARLRELSGQGFRAVRLYLYHESDLAWVANDTLAPILEATAQLGVVICVFGHCRMLDALHTLAGQHRRVSFVLDHLGHPDIDQPASWPQVLRFGAMPNVYIKVSDFPHLSTTAYPFADVHPFVAEALGAFGARRMMWASNFPHVVRQPGYAPALALVDAALPGLPAADRAWIMGGTAAELWGL